MDDWSKKKQDYIIYSVHLMDDWSKKTQDYIIYSIQLMDFEPVLVVVVTYYYAVFH